MDYIIHILPNMFSGLGVSAKIFVLTFVLALPIGILLAMVRISHVALFRKLAAIYIYVMRGTPLMLQIMFIYYGLPLMLHVQVSDFPAAILAFVANYAAYFAEISEAASSLSARDSMKEPRCWASAIGRPCGILSFPR